MRLSLLPLLLVLLTPLARAEDYPYPDRVRVLPLVFVPADQEPPSTQVLTDFAKHMDWAQRRYAQLLPDHDGFEIVQKRPVLVPGRFPLRVYLDADDYAAEVVHELLARYRVNRFTCPYVFCVVLVNPCQDVPAGGGRPLNGGFNRGGGVVVMSSFGLEHVSSFQSTLRHELGHAFGLVHVDSYGDDMSDSPSLMSYDADHKTKGFEPAVEAGRLIPEDLRALARNQRVFPGLRFRRQRDAPGYTLRPAQTLGPMEIPDEARFVADLRRRRESGVGYELHYGVVRAGHEPSWNRAQGLANLRWNLANHPRRRVNARFEGFRLHADAAGYELYYNGVRVGHDAGWTRDHGLANLRWNQETKPHLRIVARHGGQRLLWAEKRGYELFYGGSRVGHEPSWSREQGLANLRWNLETYPDGVIEARHDGRRLRVTRK